MQTPEQAIALCRVSSDEQLKNHSLNKQNAAVCKIAEEYNLEIVRIWSGSVSSKRGKNTERKDLKEMLDFCKKNKRVKYLIVDEPDRFMRSIDEAFYFEVVFKKRGVTLLYSDPELNSDSLMSKMQRFVKYFQAEGSNEERITKGISFATEALQAGRWPFPIPLGYRKTLTPGIPEIDPVIGPLLQRQLRRIAQGIVSPTRALKDFNESMVAAGIERAQMKMDKWRACCLNSFYCGVVEKHKVVDVRNPHGLHKKLITPAEHEKIVEIITGKRKNQKGPQKGGNPTYPFSNMITHADCPLTISKYNSFVGVTVKNNRGKSYEKYRCRGCYMSMPNNDMREKIAEIAASIELTEAGKKALADALDEVFELEAGDIKSEKDKLFSQRAAVKKETERLMKAYVSERDGPMKDHIRSSYDEAVSAIRGFDLELEKLTRIETATYSLFMKFALDFINDLAHRIFELTPKDMRLCKQLLFPSGFFVSGDGNVYTHHFSPIYRWAETKNDSFESENSLMVRVKRL